MSPTDQEPSAAADLGSRLEFETLLADLSSRFINLEPGDVDREIEVALGRVCELLGIDYAVLWQWSDATPGVITPTHVYPSSSAAQTTGMTAETQFPWIRQQMLAGRPVVLPSLDDAPGEAAVDVASARLAGITSSLVLPLSVGGASPLGALALNTLRTPRMWSDVLVNRLQLFTQVFTHALARRRADQALRESEQSSRATFDQAAVGIAHVGTDGRWLRVNDRLCAIVGYPREELLHLTFQDITHPDDLETDLHHMRQVLSGEIPTYSMEKRYIRKDRSLVWINLTVSLARNVAGEPRHFISVVEDITERRRAEGALRTSEARLEAGADLAGLAFYEADFGTGTMYVDARLRDICGIPPGRTKGLQPLEFWTERLHPDDRQRVLEMREQMQVGALDRISLEYRYLHPTRGERWMHHARRAVALDAAGRPIRTLGVLRDVTDRKRGEDELRNLSRRLIRAQEEERALLARELHDDVTQRLAVLAIDAGRAELAAPGGPQAETMRAMREGLVRLSEDIHSLAYQLHPSVLEELGLAEALRTECERRTRRGHVEIAVEIEPRLPAVERTTALCLYRVAQEALSNVIRHAQARTASVVLRSMDGGLLLAVRDDGVGFDADEAKQGRRLGLASMRERLRLVNGTVDIESAPGHGTAVVAWAPAEEASS